MAGHGPPTEPTGAKPKSSGPELGVKAPGQTRGARIWEEGDRQRMSEVAQDPPAGAVLTPYASSLATVPYTRIRELGELAMSMDGVLRLYFGSAELEGSTRRIATQRFVLSRPGKVGGKNPQPGAA